MAFEKVVRLYCDGPDCHNSVFGESAAQARTIARKFHGWYRSSVHRVDTCSEKCYQAHQNRVTRTLVEAATRGEIRRDDFDKAVDPSFK